MRLLFPETFRHLARSPRLAQGILDLIPTSLCQPSKTHLYVAQLHAGHQRKSSSVRGAWYRPCPRLNRSYSRALHLHERMAQEKNQVAALAASCCRLCYGPISGASWAHSARPQRGLAKLRKIQGVQHLSLTSISHPAENPARSYPQHPGSGPCPSTYLSLQPGVGGATLSLQKSAHLWQGPSSVAPKRAPQACRPTAGHILLEMTARHAWHAAPVGGSLMVGLVTAAGAGCRTRARQPAPWRLTAA